MSAKHSTGVYQIRNLVNDKRYIGSAAYKFATRWCTHRYQLKTGKHHSRALQRAWNKYGEAAFAFEIILICAPADCVAYEQICLDYFGAADGTHGYNSCPIAGSSLGVKHTEKAKENMGRAKRGKPKTAEHRAKIGAASKRNMTPEHKAKLLAGRLATPTSPEGRARQIASRTGRKASPESRAKMSASRKGKKHGPHKQETRDKIGLANRGKKRTPEQIARLAATRIGRKHTLEARAKIAAAHLGKKHSDAARASMSAGQQRRWHRASNQRMLF